MSEDETSTQAETDKVRADVAATPAPGSDPDSRLRLAKHLEAAGLDPGDVGLSTDDVTDKDREDHTAKVDKERDRLVKEAAQSRKQAAKESSEGKQGEPQGRTSPQDKQHTTTSTKPTSKG